MLWKQWKREKEVKRDENWEIFESVTDETESIALTDKDKLLTEERSNTTLKGSKDPEWWECNTLSDINTI